MMSAAYKKLIGCVFMVSLSSCTTTTHSPDESNSVSGREANFQEFVEQTLDGFWRQRAKPQSFINRQQLTIQFVEIVNPEARDTVVISPGRVEGYLKYKELAYDLFNQGYRVFIIDHQGQGLSQRRLSNPHKGYVASFDDYVADLHQLIVDHIQPNQTGQLYLLAHSMGGAIGLRYLQSHPEVFDKAALSSPMWGFRSGAVPEVIARGLVEVGHWISGNISEESPYFLGGKDYDPTPFDENELTESKARYEYFRQVYQETPELQLGGITFAWLDASIQGLERAQTELAKVTIPLLVLQAGADTIIENEAQNTFCQTLADLGNPCVGAGPEVIPGAKHEIFIETDSKREQAMQLITGYFNTST